MLLVAPGLYLVLSTVGELVRHVAPFLGWLPNADGQREETVYRERILAGFGICQRATALTVLS